MGRKRINGVQREAGPFASMHARARENFGERGRKKKERNDVVTVDAITSFRNPGTASVGQILRLITRIGAMWKRRKKEKRRKETSLR